MNSYESILAAVLAAAFMTGISGLSAWAGSPTDKGSTPLKVIELSGSYSEIGEKWGRALKADIQTALELEIHGLAQYFKMEKDDLIQMAAKYMPASREFDPEFFQVLEGIAKGSGRSLEEIFSLRTVFELMFYIQKIPAMCTSFAVGPDATKDGVTLIGQTVDWHSGMPMALLKITWPNQVRQLSLVFGGCVWELPLSDHHQGSPYGLGATGTVSLSESQDVNRAAFSIVMNKAMRQKRLEQALQVFVSANGNMESYLLASAEGSLIGIEQAANQYEILYPENDILVHANHFLTDRFKPMDVFAPFIPDTYLRYSRLRERIEKNHGSITPELMMEMMGDHLNYPRSVCTHVDPDSPYPPAETLASVVMVPAEKAIYVAAGQPCKTPFVRYGLD